MFRLIYDISGTPRAIGNAMHVPVTEGESYRMGEALVITDGKATKCAATVKPTHMCSQDLAAGAAEHVLIYPVTGTMCFETSVNADPTTLAAGSKVTLADDAMGVTATTADGVCEVVNLNGATKSGDKIVVKF